jgi:ABC-type transport system involved in multi-copper enzyme maturation permease subunit
MRLSLGPIYAYERLAATRRRQLYALRALCVAMLLAGMALVWIDWVADKGPLSLRAQADVGEWYFYAMIGAQLALVLLAAPAFTAGSICEDRTKGVLAHLFVTDLSDAEIVLGKLGAQLAPVLGLVACAIPVAMLASLLGGIDSRALVPAFLVAAAVAVLGCTLALTLSLWARTTHEALVGVYAIWAILLLLQPVWQVISTGSGIPPPPPLLLRLNPYWLSFAFYMAPKPPARAEFATFFGLTLGVSLALIALCIARLRQVTQAFAHSVPRQHLPARLSVWGRLRRALPGPSLDRNPVLWREWYRNRPAGRGWRLWTAFAATYSVTAVLSVRFELANGVNGGRDYAGLALLFLMMFGLLMLSASAATSLSEERMRGSLDVLLATRLRSRSIVWGKWWASFRAVPLLAFWPATLAATIAFAPRAAPASPFTPQLYVAPDRSTGIYIVALMFAMILAHGAVITSLGLALATWIPRQRRAVALCTVYFVAVAVGWPFFTSSIYAAPGGSDRFANGLACLCPLLGVGTLLNCAEIANPRSATDLAWLSSWTIFLASVAAILLLATYLTFDRCLGRISDWRDELGETLGQCLERVSVRSPVARTEKRHRYFARPLPHS